MSSVKSTAVYHSVRKGIAEKVKQNLRMQAQLLGTLTKEHRTLLHFAVEDQFPDICKLLLDYADSTSNKVKVGGVRFIDVADDNEETALHIAIRKENLGIVKVLLLHDARLVYAHQTTALHLAVKTKSVAITLAILEKMPADQVNFAKGTGVTALHIAAEGTRRPAAEQIAALVNAGANVNMVRFSDRMTALHMTATSGNFQAMHSLIKGGASVNVRDSSGSTALHYAADRMDSQMVRFLLSHGANPNLLDLDHLRPAWQYGCPAAFFEVGYYPHIPKDDDDEIIPDFSSEEIVELAELDYCIDELVYEQFDEDDEEVSIEIYRLMHEQGCHLAYSDYLQFAFGAASESAQADIILAILNSATEPIEQEKREYSLISSLRHCEFGLFQQLLREFCWKINDKLSESHTEDYERKWPLLHEAIADDETDIDSKLSILHFLITSMNADVTSSLDDLGRAPLVLACIYSANLSIIKLLAENGARVDENSLLHSLIKNCSKFEEESVREVVAYLLTQGANAETVNEDEDTPLSAAAKAGLMKIVTLLERHLLKLLNEERQRCKAVTEQLCVK